MREGWISCAIGDVVEQVKRVQSLNDNEQYRLLGVRWYGMGAFHRETVTTASSKANKFFRVHTGDFIYNRLFAWKGAFAVIEDELDGHCVSGEFPVFRTDPERLLPEYLFHYMARPQIWDRILLESTGSTATSRNRWKEDRFLSMEIDLPPIDVQRRIVDLISSIDQAIEAAKPLISLVDAVWASLIAKETSEVEQIGLREVVATAKAGGTPSRDRPDFYNGDIPWLKSGEVANGEISEAEEAITEKGLANSSAWLVPAGAVLVAMYGATAGAVGYLQRPMATNQAVLALIGEPSQVDQRFLYHWLRSRAEHMKARATGAAQPNLSKARVLEEPFPLLDVESQRGLSITLDSILDIADQAKKFVSVATSLRNQLGAALLSGEHTIPDSYDHLLEDAS